MIKIPPDIIWTKCPVCFRKIKIDLSLIEKEERKKLKHIEQAYCHFCNQLRDIYENYNFE